MWFKAKLRKLRPVSFAREQNRERGRQDYESCLQNEIIPVLDAATLLQPHQSLITQIRSVIGVQTSVFEENYLYSLETFSKFVQQLPLAWGRNFNRRGGLLEYTLELCDVVLRLRRATILPVAVEAEDIERREPLWTFVCFVAALMSSINRVTSHAIVILYNSRQEKLGRWNTLTGPVPQALNYQYRGMVEDSALGDRSLGLIHLNDILSDKSLAWLRSDEQALAALLDSINQSEDSVIYELVCRARKSLLNDAEQTDNFAPDSVRQPETMQRQSKDRQRKEVSTKRGVTLSGSQMIRWLVDSINNNTLVPNHYESLVHKLDAGLFVRSPEVFKYYARNVFGDVSVWKKLQDNVFTLNWHIRNDKGKGQLVTCVLCKEKPGSTSSPKSQTRVKGILLPLSCLSGLRDTLPVNRGLTREIESGYVWP